jgi:hypothetical protein
MAGHLLRHDQDIPQAHPVDSIHGMGAQGVVGGETMTDIVTAVLLLLAALFILAFIGGACRIGTGDGEGGE